MTALALSTTTYFLIAASIVALILLFVDYIRSRKPIKKMIDTETPALPEPPGPKPWPIIGSLHIMGRYDVPYKAFADLARIYNNQIIKLRMGSVPCIVVNGLDNIKEVLITKGPQFDSRPNFARYHQLFCGDKENCKDINFVKKKKLHALGFSRSYGQGRDWLVSTNTCSLGAGTIPVKARKRRRAKRPRRNRTSPCYIAAANPFPSNHLAHVGYLFFKLQHWHSAIGQRFRSRDERLSGRTHSRGLSPTSTIN